MSHLLYADDTLLFCKDNPDYLACLGWLLMWLEALSGLKINLGKSEIFPIGGRENIEALTTEMGCDEYIKYSLQTYVLLIIDFWMLCHALAWDLHTPTWVTKVSPNLIHFKAHPRGFQEGYKLDLERHKKGGGGGGGIGKEGRLFKWGES